MLEIIVDDFAMASVDALIELNNTHVEMIYTGVDPEEIEFHEHMIKQNNELIDQYLEEGIILRQDKKKVEYKRYIPKDET